ncbi:MAG: phage integrase family protein [Devosia sp.]|uniref:tyrosine-type recombinase/integrase n=1 Tax=Devosia sp. TaxID=1871048 RepID=UPI00260265A9|nr:site-specific integrase [Devosia sp.]MDB5585082.1 phage integrase family protein [Devosia sp.]
MPKVLTAAAVGKLKATKTRQEIPDGTVPGLYLIIQASGVRSWALRYRFGGKSRKYTLGNALKIKLAEARTLAREALRAVTEGEDPAASRRSELQANKDSDRHFPAVAWRYIIRHQIAKGNRTWKEVARQLGFVPFKPSGLEQHDQSLIKYVVPADDKATPLRPMDLVFTSRAGGLSDRWKARTLDSIGVEEIIKELDAQAPVQANRFLNTLRTLWQFARSPRARLATANPLEGIERQTPETSRDKVLSDEELRRVWNSAKDMGQPWSSLIRMLILSAQRRDEVARLPWSELDLVAKKWTIPSERAKNGLAHLVHLSPPMLAELARLPSDREFVFSRGLAPVGDYSDAKAQLDRLSGVTGWTFHDLRRTAATKMAELGIHSAVVDALLNHKSGASRAGVAGVYNRAELEPLRYRATNAWARYVLFTADADSHGAWQTLVLAADDEYEKRLEFSDAILAGGQRWESFLSALRGDSGNVVGIRGAV